MQSQTCRIPESHPAQAGRMPLVPALRRDVPPLDANILKDLVEGGGHGEMPAAAQQQSLSALIEARLINRVVYRAGLVVHEITDAGRRYIRDMSA